MRTAGSIIVLISMLIGEIALVFDFRRLLYNLSSPLAVNAFGFWGGFLLLFILGFVVFILAIVNFFKKVGLSLLILSIVLVLISIIFQLYMASIFAILSFGGSILALLGSKK